MNGRRRPRTRPQAFSISKSSEVSKAFNSVARLLSKRDHSESELRKKLSRFYTDEAVEGAIAKADEYGYLRDPNELGARFAKSLDDRGRGFLKIQFELKKRGLPGNSPADPEVELAKALKHVDKIHSKGDDLTSACRMKINRVLRNRGFTGDTISEVFKHLKEAK